jgi:hypothetical protein
VEVQVTFSVAAEKIAPLPPETRAAPAPTGSLALRSVPPGAVVLLDGEKKAGVTDMLIEHVKAGRHEIVFQRDSRKVSGTFTVEPEKTLDLRADFGSNVIVNLSEQKKADQERREAPEERITALPAPKAEQEVPRAPAQAQRAPVPQRVISEAAKPYGELSIEMIVSREVPTFYRDSLVVEFPEAAVAANQLLAPQFLDPQTSGGDTRYLTVPAGRKIACQNALLQKQGPVAKTSGILASVQEGTYALFVSRKRWKIDFYSDKSVFDRPSQENIVIKRGERLRLKIKYAPDQNEMYSIERSTEPVASRFYEDVDALLSSRKPSIRK